jgi:hypothetical protein
MGLRLATETGVLGNTRLLLTRGWAVLSALEFPVAPFTETLTLLLDFVTFRMDLTVDLPFAGLFVSAFDLPRVTALAGRGLIDLALAGLAALGLASLLAVFAALATVLILSLGLALFERAAILSSFC